MARLVDVEAAAGGSMSRIIDWLGDHAWLGAERYQAFLNRQRQAERDAERAKRPAEPPGYIYAGDIPLGTVKVCGRCGVPIFNEHRELHDTWHEGLGHT